MINPCRLPTSSRWYFNGGLALESLSIAVIATGVLHLLLQSTPVYIHSPFAPMMLQPPTLSIQIYACTHTKEVLTFKSSARISWSRQLLLEIDTYIHRNETCTTATSLRVDFNVHVCEILALWIPNGRHALCVTVSRCTQKPA